MFYNDKEANLKKVYVLWLDVMGTKSLITSSGPIARNVLFRFHGILQNVASSNKEVKYLPLMDGVYVVCDNQETMVEFVDNSMEALAKYFIESEEKHGFVVRGAIAYGPVCMGEDLSEDASKDIYHSKFKSQLMVGLPIVQAFSSESSAAPFGIYIHESARSFASTGAKAFQGRWFMWKTVPKGMLERLERHFSYYKDRSYKYKFPTDKYAHYMEQAKQMFSN